MSKPDCPKCNGSGWLWAYELDRYHRDSLYFDDTRYSCDGEGCREYEIPEGCIGIWDATSNSDSENTGQKTVLANK